MQSRPKADTTNTQGDEKVDSVEGVDAQQVERDFEAWQEARAERA